MAAPEQDERQCWAQFVDTGDEDVRQRLINSWASKCLFHARKTRRQDRWDAFMTLRDEVGRIIDRRDFDPDLASLPTFVGRLLALRVKDVERGIRTRAKLFDQISLREPPAGGEDDDSAAEIAEAVGVIDAEVDRVERLLASLADEVDRQIVRLALEGNARRYRARPWRHSAGGRKKIQKNWEERLLNADRRSYRGLGGKTK